MIVIRAKTENDVYRIIFNAIRTSAMPATVVYVGRAKPKGVYVHKIEEELLPSVPGYLVYRTGRIEYPEIIIGIVTRGNSRHEAVDRLLEAIEGYKGAVVKEEL